jgi:type II secretory pathway component GspD/PulD (secretin)
VTLRAVDADVRSLLVALAQIAGVNLIVSPEVRGRLSLALEQVPAEDALSALMEAAGLSAPGVLRSPWGATVFFQPPVLLDTLSAEAIARRFGVSARLARWVVELRSR